MESKAKTHDVEIFVAEKWVDSVVSVERHNEKVSVLKMVLGAEPKKSRLEARTCLKNENPCLEKS